MNHKGFTIIEILAVLVIIGLILTLATTNYSNISKSVREKQKEEIIANIEIEASKYAFDTNKTIVFVDELINKGYIDADNDMLVDPTNNESMNCYVVEMNRVGDYYNAKFNSSKNLISNGECDYNALAEENIEIKVNGNPNFNANEWISGTVTLEAYYSGLNINCNTNLCTWTSSSGISKNGSNILTIENNEGLFNNKYNFQYSIYENNKITRYNAIVNLKIDNEKPIINKVIIENEMRITNTKKLIIDASDGNGSGISGYGISKTNNCSSYNTSNEITVSENGTYNICIKDKMNNINSTQIKISNIA